MLNPRAKLLWHGDRVKEWLETGRSKPILMEIAPSARCNASCPWCFFKNKHSIEMINSKRLCQALRDMKNLGLTAINWTGGGEPTLHPDFENFVLYASVLGLKQGLFTNGYVEIPRQEMFSWIRISLTPEGLSKIKKPSVPFGICCNQTALHTKNEIETLCKESYKFGASYFQIRPALPQGGQKPAVLEFPDYLKKLETPNFAVYLTPYKYADYRQERGYELCYGYHFVPALNWRGELNTCLYHSGDPRFILGNINEDKICNIWNRIKHVKVIPECQRCCKNHEINKILANVQNVEHTSFL